MSDTRDIVERLRQRAHNGIAPMHELARLDMLEAAAEITRLRAATALPSVPQEPAPEMLHAVRSLVGDDPHKAAIWRAMWAAAPVTPQWQPIETAPRDGALVLLAGCRKIVAAAWVEHDIDWWHVDDNKHGPFALRGPAPTHWMPLPAAPQAQQPAQQGATVANVEVSR